MEKVQIIKKFNLKINQTFESLLKKSKPNDIKAYQLAKQLQREGAGISATSLLPLIGSFYEIPFSKRSSFLFQKHFGLEPYPWLMMQFNLKFHSLKENSFLFFKATRGIIYWIENHFIMPDQIYRENVIYSVIQFFCSPQNRITTSWVELDDFVWVWRRQVAKSHGNKYEAYFDDLLKLFEMQNVESVLIQIKDEGVKSSGGFDPYELVTQTDLDWMKEVVLSLQKNERLPDHPHSHGPKDLTVINLEKITRILNRKGITSADPNLIQLKDHLIGTCKKYNKRFGQGVDKKSEMKPGLKARR